MKRLATILTLTATLAASATAFAGPRWHHGDRDGFVAYARVTSVRPIFRAAYEPQRECRVYRVGEREVGDQHRAAGTVLGAVIGGVLGNTLGKGDGRAAATVAGAVIGGAIGNRAAASDDRYRDMRPVYQRRCDTRPVRVGRQLVGYDVGYRFRGRYFHTRMNYDPGRRLRVWVDDGDVRPAS